MQLHYNILNVFTTEVNAGNPLAVVHGADHLNDVRMQAIAKEFNFSETVFLRRPEKFTNAASLRIFTPKYELPFAGHPTIGAAVWLGIQKRAAAVRLEEKIGRITCVVERKNKTTGSARFILPEIPEDVGAAPDNDGVAKTLGISPEEIGFGAFPVTRQFSAGISFYLIPVKNAEVLANLKLERRGWASIYPERAGSVYVFTATPEERGVDFAARMFSPNTPTGEDPATGSAAGALIGLLAEDPAHSEGQRNYTIRQGWEMGRKSIIEIQVGLDAGRLVHASIGGSAVTVADGLLEIPDEEETNGHNC